MLQHYRERVGEVDVVPMFPELLPDADKLVAVLRGWCDAEGIAREDVFGDSAPQDPDPDESSGDAHEKAERKDRGAKTPKIVVNHKGEFCTAEPRDDASLRALDRA